MEQVVEEAILAVPHLILVLSNAVHRIGDPKKMLEEPEGNLLVHRVVPGQNERNLQHALAVKRHPCCAISLIEIPAGRKGGTAVKYTDVVESEKSSGEDVLPLRILAVYPPI